MAAHPLADELIHKLYDIVEWGPTAYNGQPGRYVFARSEEAKAKLKPAVSVGNTAQALAAGVTVIVAHDTRFYEHLPTQFLAYDAMPFFRAWAPAGVRRRGGDRLIGRSLPTLIVPST